MERLICMMHYRVQETLKIYIVNVNTGIPEVFTAQWHHADTLLCVFLILVQRCIAMQCSHIQWNTLHCSHIQWNTLHCSHIQWNTLHCSHIQWNTLHCSHIQWKKLYCKVAHNVEVPFLLRFLETLLQLLNLIRKLLLL